MNESSAGNFFIELSSIFNPKGFDQAESKISKTTRKFNSDTNSSLSNFFNKTSTNFLNLQGLTTNVFDNIHTAFSQMLANMASQFLSSGIFNLFGFGGGGGFFSSISNGILGSRRTGGPIGKTGNYLLHEGEFVLPPELVNSIKQNSKPNLGNQQNRQFLGTKNNPNVNITLNSPINVEGNISNELDIRRICEQITQNAKDGVSWALENAKTSYRLGKEKSTEA